MHNTHLTLKILLAGIPLYNIFFVTVLLKRPTALLEYTKQNTDLDRSSFTAASKFQHQAWYLLHSKHSNIWAGCVLNFADSNINYVAMVVISLTILWCNRYRFTGKKCQQKISNCDWLEIHRSNMKTRMDVYIYWWIFSPYADWKKIKCPLYLCPS